MSKTPPRRGAAAVTPVWRPIFRQASTSRSGKVARKLRPFSGSFTGWCTAMAPRVARQPSGPLRPSTSAAITLPTAALMRSPASPGRKSKSTLMGNSSRAVLLSGAGRLEANPLSVDSTVTAAPPVLHLDGAAPVGKAGEVVNNRTFPVLARRHRRDAATGLEHHDAVATRGAGDLHRLAEQLAPGLRYGHGGIGESDPSRSLRYRRQGRDNGHAIAGEAELALDLGSLQPLQGHDDFQVEIAVALGAHAVGEVVDPVRHRAGRHEAQEIPSGTAGPSPDAQDLLRGLQVGNHHRHPRQLGAEDAPPIGGDLHAGAFEQQLPVDGVDGRPTRGVIQAGSGDASPDLELPALAVHEGKVLQVALEAQPSIQGSPANNAVLQPIPGFAVHHQGKVAPHRRAVGAGEAGLEIDDARPRGRDAVSP